MSLARVHRSSMLIGVLLPISCACAVPQGKLATVYSLSDKSAFRNKPSVYFALPGNAPPGFKSAIENVAAGSSLFRSVSFDPAQAEEADYTIKMWFSQSIRGTTEEEGPAIMGFVHVSSLFIIPAPYWVESFSAVAEVKDPMSGLVKSYTVDDSIIVWFGLVSIPLFPYQLMWSYRTTWTNIVRTLFQKMVEDDLFRYSSLDRPPARLPAHRTT